ncbi:hypothetical protein WJX77_005759 [Trebouxia sp. C0004]
MTHLLTFGKQPVLAEYKNGIHSVARLPEVAKWEVSLNKRWEELLSPYLHGPYGKYLLEDCFHPESINGKATEQKLVEVSAPSIQSSVLMPSASEVKGLYKAFLREGKKFSNYNVREFVQRKAKADFRSNAAQTDKTAIEQMWMQAKRDLEVAKRQTLVYSLYGSRQKSVMDIPMVKVLQQQAEDAPYTTA